MKPSYDVTEASIVVYEAAGTFHGTIHVVVVDPGVGVPVGLLLPTIPLPTEDAVTGSGLNQQDRGNGQIYIAPDNGVLSCFESGFHLRASHHQHQSVLSSRESDVSRARYLRSGCRASRGRNRHELVSPLCMIL